MATSLATPNQGQASPATTNFTPKFWGGFGQVLATIGLQLGEEAALALLQGFLLQKTGINIGVFGQPSLGPVAPQKP